MGLGEAAVVKAELVIGLADLGEEHEGRGDFPGGVFDGWGIRGGVMDVGQVNLLCVARVSLEQRGV